MFTMKARWYDVYHCVGVQLISRPPMDGLPTEFRYPVFYALHFPNFYSRFLKTLVQLPFQNGENQYQISITTW